MEFRRRLVGYSPVAVAQYLYQSQTERTQRIAKLRDELQAARAESDTLYAQVIAAGARLSQILAHSRDLNHRAVEHLSNSGRPMMDFRERNVRIEAALASELDRVRAVLRQMSDVQSRFGADMEGVMNRFHDLKQSLSIELPAPNPISERPGSEPDPLTFLKKSVAP